MTNHQSKYPLLPYSQLVWEMTRWMPGVYLFPLKFVWKNGAKEKERIVQAVEKAIQNHPVFIMRVDRNGMHYADQNTDWLQGPYVLTEVEERGEDLVIKAIFNRILGDGKSGQILLEDVARAFRGEPLKKDDYWGYVARYEQCKSEAHYAISRDWLVKQFADESIPVHPTIDRRWLATILPPKAGLYIEDYTSLQEQIQHIATDYHLTLDGVFSLCAALAIADYCGTESAALTWAYEGRELPEEQRIFGSLHRDVPFHIRKSIIDNRESAIREARNQIRFGIAHSDYPYTLTAPYTKRWNYAVNVLHMTDLEDFLPSLGLPLQLEPIPEQKYAYALLDIEIVEHADSLQLRYRYSATHYKPESIRRFAALVRKHVEWLID
jgi:hypothetical protein